MNGIAIVATWTLAQTEAWRTEGPRPPHLTGGDSALLIALFERPVLTAAVAVFLGLVLFFALMRAGKWKKAIVAAAAAVLVGGGCFVLASLVTTEREQVKARTRDLVAAVEQEQIITIEKMLAPGADGAYYGRTVVTQREPMIGKIDRALKDHPVDKAHITTLEAASRSPGAAQTRCRVLVWTRATFYDAPLPMWFLVDWRRSETDEWIATRVELEMIEGKGGWERIRP